VSGGTLVLHEDFRALRYCNPGCRRWFKRYGFDWHDMLRNGIPAARLSAVGDAQADRVVERAEQRERGEVA